MKKIFSIILKGIGTVLIILALCTTDFELNLPSVSLLIGLLVSGGLFCAFGIKLEYSIYSADEESKYPQLSNENNINYSKEIEKLYNSLILLKVNQIIKEGE